MVIRSGEPVAAGLNQIARMDRRERTRIVRLLCARYPAFRSLLIQVTVARGIAFGSGLVLAVAIVLAAEGVPVVWVSTLVLCGLVGFGSVAVVLTDSRFDLLLAVIGAHRTDELHERLVTEQLYGDGSPADMVGANRSEDEQAEGDAHQSDRICCRLPRTAS